MNSQVTYPTVTDANSIAIDVAPSIAISKRELQELSTRRFVKWFVPVMLEWGTIGCLFAIGFVFDRLLVWAAVTVLLGSRQHALGLLGHESVHYAVANSKRLNDAAAELLCFWPLTTGLAEFRRFHLAHHRHCGTDRDPELLFKHTWSRSQFTLPTTRGRIVRQFLLDTVGFGLPEVMKAQWMLGRSTLRSWLGPIGWWTAAGTALYAAGLGFAAVIWFAALGTSFWGFHRLRVWTEHVGTDTTHRIQANWWQRILITPHGSWSHLEHHAYPSIPFWRRNALRTDGEPAMTIGELYGSFASMSDVKDSSRSSVPIAVDSAIQQSERR